MTTIASVLSKATRLVLPSDAEQSRVGELASTLLGRTSRVASKHPECKGALLGGSFAKGTWLPDEVDLDIFVRFDPLTPEDAFERLGLAVGQEATKGFPKGKKYAQHPYTEATVGGVKVNIVPCYEVVDKEWKSAADRSPFHVVLVSAIPESMKTQVRLLKKFMKGVGVYGAEIETRGFSGYVAEVLAMKLGGFVEVVKHFAGYAISDPKRPFSLPDPVDPARDLGIAVSAEKLGVMILASREFLKRPGLAFFTKLSGRSRPAVRRSVVAIVFSHQKLSEDTLWGELRKTSKHLVRHLEVNGFKVARWMAASNNLDQSAILLIPEFYTLPADEQRVGPTVDRKKDVEAFLSSNSKASKLVWVDDDARVRILRPRPKVKLADLLVEIARGKTSPIGASPELERGMKRSGKVLEGAPLSRAASSRGWLRDGIREITTDALGARPS